MMQHMMMTRANHIVSRWLRQFDCYSHFFFEAFRCSVKFHSPCGFSCRVLHVDVHVPISADVVEFCPRPFLVRVSFVEGFLCPETR